MKRDVSTRLDVEVHARTVLEFQIAVARRPGLDILETFEITRDGHPVVWREVAGSHGTRIHIVESPAGAVRAHYRATVTGTAHPEPASEYDLSLYLRPSRFAESDRLLAYAAAEFGYGADDPEIPARISDWVGRRVRYVAHGRHPSDGAVETLLSGTGVCRDFAHLVVALLRAVGVPARIASVYAPGCVPMDFHCVAEAYVRGEWHTLDPTRLAPRPAMVRIATGRDASDIAFLDNHGGALTVTELRVDAVTDDPMPADDFTQPYSIG
ncbi:transglutaminase-like putative cysteine protease [Nocardia transvalensis]|uniref:Transglutaminase-like putative cysteine protease n=1 Tax=Nocardia transvalensis TaxID=37333 RepID=A0A7W9PDN6_9NOCA|nr:transglutaminase domain-containing protein [Nocardia transvalensis]MBB5913768.1 transglutaminase-like putative cysteine protease [Nocardia transvalensis]